MSQGSNSSESPSLLSNLRRFRFQKKNLEKLATAEEKITSIDKNLPSVNKISSTDTNISSKNERIDSSEEDTNNHISTMDSSVDSVSQIGFKRKVVKCIQESDDDDEVHCLGDSEEVALKENCLKLLIEAFPDNDKMVLQDALLHCQWNIEKAKKKVTQDNIIGQMKRKLSEISDKSNYKKVRMDVDNIEEERDDDEDDRDASGFGERVFDSDNSDEEMPDVVSGDRKKVLDFLSNATAAELRTMPNCSQKKADAIIEQRPFTGWKDLVEKFQNGKFLGTDILNSAQEVLQTRQEVRALMKKCVKLANQMEQAVVAGGSNIKKQPSLIPKGFNLTAYQMVGLNWLAVMHHQKLNGILADEMGLGKTIQVIAFMAYLKEMKFTNRGPHLIVVPSSTLENWQNEIDAWCPSLKVAVYYGSRDERKLMRVNWVRKGMDDIDVILTTYSIIGSSPEERKMFRVLELQYVILDEAHMLKNMTTIRYDYLMRINAPHRILLTGTPLQNNLLELMSLLIFVMPKIFSGVKDHLKSLFSKTPKQGDNEEETDNLPKFEREQIEQARRIMKPFILRRLKADVLKHLPTKTANTLYCPLAKSQREKYDELRKTFSQSAKKEYSDNHMAMMMTLRKMSNHPLLLRYYYNDDLLKELAKILVADPTYKQDNEAYMLEDLQVMSDFEIYQLTKSKGLSKFYLPSSLILESGKFQKFDELLPDLKKDSHRVIIFSQFVIMLNVMEEYLKIRKYGYLRFDGSTPVPERQELIDKFNEDPSIFVILLSTRAGGMGINLTAADTVIIHDIDFNPYNDKQAEDRCHRVGQTRNVKVLRFISEGTIEVGIYRIAQEKLILEKEINQEEGETAEQKTVVSLLKEALGMDPSKANL